MESCRKRKALERKMYALLREIFGYIMFMWLVIVIAYNQTDRHAYLLTKNIKDVFFSSDEFESVIITSLVTALQKSTEMFTHE